MNASHPLQQLHAAGQSVWYDNIHRSMLSGELTRLISEDGLRGITSNPTIFQKAISEGSTYDDSIRILLAEQKDITSRELFFRLAVADIQTAADQLLPIFDVSNKIDGRVSLEVSPDLAYDAEATIHEARALHAQVARPNVMIKVPATEAGLAAIEQLTCDGISINVTLLFAVSRYEAVVEAYLRGLERRHERGLPLADIASVASFFISRVDSAIDPRLADTALRGQIAIANAKLAYRRYQALFNGERFHALQAAGANPQRLLWASTGSKNPDYPDVYYVEHLIGPDTVNTLPPATFSAFRDHGQVARTLDQNVEQAATAIAALGDHGIDLDAVTLRLETEGVEAFNQAFKQLLATIDAKAEALVA